MIARKSTIKTNLKSSKIPWKICVKKFVFSKFADLQTYSGQLYWQMNSFTGIFRLSPPCIDSSRPPPPPPPNLKEALSMGGHSPHVLNTCGNLTVLMTKINFNLLQILAVNSLNIKHQGKISNQLAFNLSAYMYLWEL